ncbi:MAG TPA: hypothetical protein VNV62_19675 [Trebonia sp.]|jgi:hypothetical protein|nr:hypothetical protein [Trebonia sp.]
MTTTAVTMEELEAERGELLPSRETLHVMHSYSFSSVNQYGAGNVNGSHNFGSGDGNINVSGNQVFVLPFL